MRAHGLVASSIPVPGQSPQSVREAHERFSAVAAKFGEAQSVIHTAEAKLSEARAQDTERVAAQLVEGLEPTDVRQAEEAVENEVGDAQRLVAALTKALDDAGDALADAITAEQPKWREMAAKDADRSLKAFHEHRAAMESALADHAESKAIVRWLTPEPIESAIGGRSKALRGWTGSRMLIGPAGDQVWRGASGVSVRTDEFFRLDNPAPVAKILPLLARVGEKDAPTTVKLSAAKVNPKVEGAGEAITSKEKIRG
jgi:hypothetical protein